MVRYNQTNRGRHALICVPTTQQYRELANIHVKPTDVVLEVGSAHGKTTKLLATIARQVVGIDCDRKMLAHAKKTYQRPNMSFHYYNALELNAPNQEDPQNPLWKESLLPEGETEFTVVFIDCGGTIPMYMLAPILKAIREGIRPRLIVCKSLNLDKLQHQIFQGQNENGTGSIQGSSERSKTAKNSSRPSHNVPAIGAGLQRQVGRCQQRLWERCEHWLTRQKNVKCHAIVPVPDVILAASSQATRENASKLKSWRYRAEASNVSVFNLSRCFPCVSNQNDTIQMLLLAPGESFPTQPWSTCSSTTIRKQISRDDYFAYSKYQMMSPFSHGFPVVLSNKCIEYMSDTAHSNVVVVIECAPGRYLKFDGIELQQLMSELIDNDVARGGTAVESETKQSSDEDYMEDYMDEDVGGSNSSRISSVVWFGAGLLTATIASFLFSKRRS